MKEFAADFIKISSGASSDDENGNDDVEVIETTAIIPDISDLKGAAAEEISHKLMSTVEDLVKCSEIDDLFELALRAMAAIQSIKLGSTSDGQNTTLSLEGGLVLRKIPPREMLRMCPI